MTLGERAEKGQRGSLRIRGLLVLGALGLALGGALWGLWKASQQAHETEGEGQARKTPEFALPGPQGKTHRLQDYRGRVVVLHFWASWCPPCLGEIPLWLDLATKWKGRPVSFIAVSLDKNWEDALKILPGDRLPENVISVLDQSQKLPDLYGTYQYPETYLIDPELKIAAKWVGPQEWSSPAIQSAIERLLPSSVGQ